MKPVQSSLIVVYGPTACGKSARAVELAKELNGEIISADSRQIYRGLDIGTGKITEAEMQWIPHYMLDIIDPSEVYSVADFKEEADRLIADIVSRGKTPILCGGTGLYLDAVMYDFGIPIKANDESYRDELEAFKLEHGNLALWEKLHELDPNYAVEIHPNSYPYVIRALEVLKVTGKSKTFFRQERTLRYATQFVTPYTGDREKLYERINIRVREMFENGLIDEVSKLLSLGYTKDQPGLNSIGYTETINYLEWTLALEDAISLTQQGNRNYAKRQTTWFRKYPEA